jgi:HAD superfamily hydrolase (TIGR01509 family)
MSKIEAVIFDLDGVMVDTETISNQAWKIVLRDLHAELDEKTGLSIIGHSSDESAQIIKSSIYLSIDASELLFRKRKVFRQLLSKGIPVMPGLQELVEHLSETGLPWAVATSSPREYAESILRQIGLRNQCSVLVSGDEVVRSKPMPDIYLLAAERLHISPRNCLALEDSVPGCHAAIGAGMVTIAIPNGQTKQDNFDFVDHICHSLSEVAFYLENLSNSESRNQPVQP